MMGGRLDEVLSMVSYKSRSAADTDVVVLVIFYTFQYTS